MLGAMAGETKGFMGGSMKLGTGDELTTEEKERGPLLPLRMLVVADLVPRDPHNAGASPPEGVLRVDPARFDDLFTRIRPRIAIDVPSVLAEGRPIRVDLSPTGLKSFRPDGLLAEVPLLRALLDGRMVLERLRDGQVTVDGAAAELGRLWSGSPFAREVLGLLPDVAANRPAATATTSKPAPSPTASAGPSVDSLLDMVDLSVPVTSATTSREPAPLPVAATTGSAFSEIIATVARSGKTGAGVRPNEAVARVEKAIGAQIGAILQHPEVRRLEQAYRGLRFLTERAQGYPGVRFDVVNARPDDLAAALARAVRANASSEPPVTCAIVDLTVDGTAVGFARLEAVAETAEAYNVPVIVNGSARLLGVADLAGVERLDNKAALFTAPQQVAWRAASAKPALRWVSIALNGVLARTPYDKNTSRVREAVIKELPSDERAFVWMAPSYAVASLVLTSFKDTGWPCRILGARSGGVIENLPVHHVRGASLDGDEDTSEEGIAVPTEVFLSTDTQRELARSGVLALASAPNSDAAYVLSAPTAYVTPPKRTYDSASTEPEVRLDRASLGDQLFVARIVQFLRALCSKLPPTTAPEEAEQLVTGALWALFEDATPGSIELAAKGEAHKDGTLVNVMVRPRRFLGVQLEELSLGMPLG
jgi:type VI secretion system ImpC/EvpB family protein/type VI secretion system ImpB/VipA family protein